MDETAIGLRLKEAARLVSRYTGLDFSDGRLNDFRRGLTAASKDFGCSGLEVFLDQLLSSPILNKDCLEVLARHLTVGETYFFREKRVLEVFKKDILDEIRSRHKDSRMIRIWSAGCAGGEEPYTLAMCLLETWPDIATWDITILATDINTNLLQKASRGVYGRWSFRDCPSELRQKYFSETTDHRYEIVPEVKRMVSFAYHNLADDSFPSILNNTCNMDVIFCRNVLMYFTQEAANRAIDKFSDCFVDGGTLVVSLTETSRMLSSRFASVCSGGVTIYRKGSDQKPEPEFNDATGHTRIALSFNDDVVSGSENIKRSLKSSEAEVSPAQNDARRNDPFCEAAELLEKGLYAEAEAAARVILKGEPENARAALLLAGIKANSGSLKEAERWCRKGISKDKLNPKCHYLLATILNEQGELEEASVAFKKTIYLDPDFAPAYFYMANISLRLGKTNESSRYFKNTLYVLKKFRPDEVLPGCDGMTAGRLAEVIYAHGEALA